MAQRYWSLKDVKSKLSTHTRLLAVPGTFACSNTKYMSLSEAQAQVQAKLARYVSWATQDQRLIGLWPWHWTNRTHSQNSGPCDMRLGCEAMPGCISKIRTVGTGLPRAGYNLTGSKL